MPVNTGVLAQRFTDNTGKLSGNKARGSVNKSNITIARENGMSDIYALAKKEGVTVDEVVTKILNNSQTELKAYVQSMGETPLLDPTALGTQAVLLRANDVGRVAAILNTTDEDALQTIEQSEQESIDLNSPERDKVLTIPVQAAVSCALQHLSDESGLSMSAFIKTLNGAANLVKKSRSNAIDDYGDPSGEEDWLDWLTGDGGSDPTDSNATDNSLSFSSIGSALATIPTGTTGPISVSGNYPTVSTQGVNLPQAGSNTNAGGIFNAISGVLAGIGQVANSVTQAANSSAGAAGAVKNAVSNVGANSIATYINNNKGTIILVVLLLAIVVFAAIYAAKHK